MAPALRVVRDFHEAINERDVNRLLDLAHDDFEFQTRRGLVQGKDGLRDWLGAADLWRRLSGISGAFLRSGRDSHRCRPDGAPFVDTGELGERGDVFAIFTFEDGRVRRLDAEHADLAAAFQASGLSELDEIGP